MNPPKKKPAQAFTGAGFSSFWKWDSLEHQTMPEFGFIQPRVPNSYLIGRVLQLVEV